MLWELFKSFFQIGLFSFGGGYAVLPLIKEQVVELHNWMTLEEYADIITISQMTPGPIAINSATHVGMKIAGVIGALVTTFSSVLPSFIIALIVASLFYKYRRLKVMKAIMKGLRPAAIALIASAGVSVAIIAFFEDGEISSDIDIIAVIIFAAALFVLRKWRVNPVLVMLMTGVIGALVYAAIDQIVV